MIKKKPYEKQDTKTLYNNQQELINKQSNFADYGIDPEYGFATRRLDIRRQARNIIPYKTLSDFDVTTDVGEIYVRLPYGKYLITGYWTTTGSGSVNVYLDDDQLLTISGNQISVPINIKDISQTFSLRPSTNTGTWTYNIIFISL